ncbi:PAAR-like domain-containing protein [Providencia manganoxydans]|uniref:PAAR-like domain-containing protein n=2 Tax=Morganellaceae TaxID=1903414 RepID=UPI001122B32C|nr:PAAR-like domain-containing protein [Providencia stuartii]
MDTRVYVNEREACSKASDGVSTAAFPDPCWSPGPSVVPYPNTSKADALSNGTATVFIQNSMVAQEDRSFFSTSTGDEPATNGLAKGVMTGVIKGKAYFRSWSLNVKFEGYGVSRHQDLMTHNHGSFPSNTPTFPYISRAANNRRRRSCSRENKLIDKRCSENEKNSDTQKALKSQSKLKMALEKRKKPSKNTKQGKWHWTDDHCAGLEYGVTSNDLGEQFMGDISESIRSLKDELNYVDAFKKKLTEMAENAAKDALTKVGAKALIKQTGGSAVPGWGNAAMAVWSLGDLVYSGFTISSIKAAANEQLDQIKVLSDKAEDIKKLLKRAEDYQNLTPEEQNEQGQQLAADAQDILAALNACTRARKCNLVPYSIKSGSKHVETAVGTGGCCQGQTGHHLIFDSLIKDVCSKDDGYQHGTAPTVCVEGTNQRVGSHGRIHRAMDEEIKLLERGNKLQNNTMSMQQAIDAAIRSHQKTFPYAGCSNGCIRAQLEAYYLPKCKDARLPAQDSNGNLIGDKGQRGR